MSVQPDSKTQTQIQPDSKPYGPLEATIRTIVAVCFLVACIYVVGTGPKAPDNHTELTIGAALFACSILSFVRIGRLGTRNP